MNRFTLSTLLLALFAAFALVACEKESESENEEEGADEVTLESVCVHMEDVSEGDASAVECEASIGPMAEACPDERQAMFECLNEASKKEAVQACMVPCMKAVAAAGGGGGE